MATGTKETIRATTLDELAAAGALVKGTVVYVRSWRNELLRGVLTGWEPEGKNDRDLIDYVSDTGETLWAYVNQLEAFEKA